MQWDNQEILWDGEPTSWVAATLIDVTLRLFPPGTYRVSMPINSAKAEILSNTGPAAHIVATARAQRKSVLAAVTRFATMSVSESRRQAISALTTNIHGLGANRAALELIGLSNARR